jgi:hypothetical protein
MEMQNHIFPALVLRMDIGTIMIEALPRLASMSTTTMTMPTITFASLLRGTPKIKLPAESI